MLEIIKDMGARLLIEKDGIRSVVSKEMYDQLLTQEGGGTDIASTRNLPSLAPAPEPVFAPAPPPISSELGGSPQFQKENVAEPATITPAPKPEEVATITPVEPVAPIAPVVPTSTASMTRGEQNASIRDTADARIETAGKVSALDQEDASKILAVKEAEDAALSKAEAERTQQREEEATERRENYEDKKRMVKEFQDTKITESNVFSMKTTLQIISAGIGNIINLRAGRAQDPMAGFNIIENAIDRDLQMQMKNLDKKGKDIDAQSGLISEFRGLTGDTESAYALSKATMLDTAKRKVDMVAKRSTEERAKLKLEALGTKLGEDRDKLLMANAAAETLEKQKDRGLDIQKQQANTASGRLRETKRSNRVGEARDARLDAIKAEALARKLAQGEQDIKLGKISSDTVFGPDGVTRYRHIGGEKEAQKLRNATAEYRTFNKKADTYMRFLVKMGRKYQGVGTSRWGSAELEKANAMHKQLLTAQIKIMSGVASNKDEVKRITSYIPAPASMTSGVNPAEVIAQTSKSMAIEINNYAKENYEVLVTDEDGNQRYQILGQAEPGLDYYIEAPLGKKEPELSSAVSNLSKQIEDTKIRNENRKNGEEYPETVDSRGMTGPKGVIKSIANTNLSIKQVWDEVDEVGDAVGSKDVAVRNKIGMESLVDQLKEDAGDNRTSIALLEVEIDKLDKYINDPKVREERLMLPAVKAKAERKERKERTQKTKKSWGKDRLAELARIRAERARR